MKDVEYAVHLDLPGVSFEEAISKVEAALQAEGFGVLTTIDVSQTLKKKIGADFRRYVILGACNPELAHRALTSEDAVGLLLPCNVVVAETENGSEAAYARPTAMLSLTTSEELASVGREAEERLGRVFRALGGQAGSGS